jgi:peptide/nickel transport system permease protein
MTASDNIVQLSAKPQEQAIGQSLLQLALRRLRKDRLTLFAMAIIGVISMFSILAPVITGVLRIDYATSNVVNVFIPPGGQARVTYNSQTRLRAQTAHAVVTFAPFKEIKVVKDTGSQLSDAQISPKDVADGKAAIRFMHTAIGTNAFDVYITGGNLAGDKPSTLRLPYGETGAVISLAPGTYDIALRRGLSKPTDPVFYELKGVELKAGFGVFAVATGIADDPSQPLEIKTYGVDIANLPADKAEVVVVQASPDAPLLNAAINDKITHVGLAYKSSTSIQLSTPQTVTVSTSLPDAPQHILGTDDLGRDQLARLLYAGQVSLSIAFISAAIAIVIGVVLGIITGYYGGLIDDGVNFVITTLSSLPFLLLLLILSSVFKPGPSTLIAILGLFGWFGTSRLVRGETLSLRAREYVTSARAIGAPVSRIMFVHILPNLLSVVLITLALDIGGLILTESALSYLGFGINPPTPSWGNMLSNAQTFFTKGPHLVIYPGLLISITVLCLYLVGDGLRDAFDPTVKN